MLPSHGISNELASIHRCRQALRKKPHASVDQKIKIGRLTWAEDERGEEQESDERAPYSEAAPSARPLSAAAIWEA